MEIYQGKRRDAVGYQFYSTGKPCKHGHYRERDIETAKCMGCKEEIERKSTKKLGRIRGKYTNDIGGNSSDKAYRVWSGIVKRCSSQEKTQNCYKEVQLCEEWCTFSLFKDWYDKQHRSEDWQVDKDFLSQGTKVYSPDTCVILPPYVNTISGMRTENFQNKLGVPGVTAIYESVKGKGTLYVASVSEFRRDGKKRRLKTHGKDPKELHHWYQETKADQVEACRNYYAQHPDADTRVLERLTEIAWKLRVDRMNGVITEHV